MRRVLPALALLFPFTGAASAATPVIRTESFPGDLHRSVRAEAEAAYTEARGWFGTELASPLTVRWAADPQELRRHGVRRPRDVAGLAVADSNLVILHGSLLAPRPGRLRPVLLHEICHLFVARATARAELLPPRWLDEGIAMFVSGDWDLGLTWQADQESLLRDAAAADALLPLRDLEVSFPDAPFFSLAYAQSLSFVEWLVAREGEEALREMLHHLGEDLDAEPAFERVYGTTLGDAERAWRGTLEGPRLLRRLPSAGTLVTAVWVLLALLVVAKFVRVRRQLRSARDESPEDWKGSWRG